MLVTDGNGCSLCWKSPSKRSFRDTDSPLQIWPVFNIYLYFILYNIRLWKRKKYLEVFFCMGMWQDSGVGMESIIAIHILLFEFGYKAMMDTGEIWTMCLWRKGSKDGKVLKQALKHDYCNLTHISIMYLIHWARDENLFLTSYAKSKNPGELRQFWPLKKLLEVKLSLCYRTVVIKPHRFHIKTDTSGVEWKTQT